MNIQNVFLWLERKHGEETSTQVNNIIIGSVLFRPRRQSDAASNHINSALYISDRLVAT